MKNVQDKILSEINYIKQEIIFGKHADHILVIDTEPGVGKSRISEEAVVELHNINPTAFVIMVLRNQDSDGKIGKLYHTYKRINELAKKEIALAVDSLNIDQVRHKMKDYPILVITHEMYKALSKNEAKRKAFTEGRSMLIIDEGIQMVETCSYDIGRIKSFTFMLEDKGDLKKMYIQCVEEIVNKLKEYEQNDVKFFKFNLEKINFNKIKELRELIKINISDDYARLYIKNILNGQDGNVKRMKKRDFINEINSIENIYKNLCYCDGRFIHCYDHNIKYWLLPKNNILLNANGGFEGCYKLNSNLFKSSNRAKVFDHTNWNVYVANVNVSKRAIYTYKNYHEKIVEYAKSITKEDDKVLLICNLADEEPFRKLGLPTNIKIEHHGNIIGRNDWREYNKVIIASSCNLSESAYIMNYLYYTGDDIDINTNHAFVLNQMRQFVDKRLEMIRVSFIAGHIYQGIKRIDREVTRNSEVHLFCGDKDTINLVVKQLEKCNRHDIDISFEKKEKIKTTNKAKNSDDFQTGKLIQLLGSLKPGKYKKRKLRDDLRISQAANFSRLFKRIEVNQFMEDYNIQNLTHYIEVA